MREPLLRPVRQSSDTSRCVPDVQGRGEAGAVRVVAE